MSRAPASRQTDAILLVYHHPVVRNAPTIMEHVTSFERYSRFPVIKVNTELGLDPRLRELRFPVVVFHYSLFGCEKHLIGGPWNDYLETLRDAYKVAFFQDEYHGCPNRFAFLNRWNVNCIYTLYDPRHWDKLYLKYTKASAVRHTLAGYVDEAALACRRRWVRPGAPRPIDVGYRARKLPFYMGAGAQEKWWVARDFLERAAPLGLVTDISWREEDRIYGDDWYRFMTRCRGMLGAESGVSISDPDGEFIIAYRALLAERPDIGFAEVSDRLLCRYEDNIPLRTISPRCFEAAALDTCQLLLDGDYNGVLVPWRHYLPLKKDFSNFDEVMRAFNDPATRGAVVETAFRELVASGAYSYRTFVAGFDEALVEDSGWRGPRREADARAEQRAIRSREAWRQRAARARLALRRGVGRARRPWDAAAQRIPFAWRQRVRGALGLPLRPAP
jgi:hypothetical protein